MDKQLSELTDKEIVQQKTIYMNVTIAMAILIFLMVVTGIYSYFKKGEFKIAQIIAIFFIPMLIVFFWQLKKIKDEIVNRNLK